MGAAAQTQIFLSYSREDVVFARELREWLLTHGHAPWMDLFDIPAGARWPDEIDKALRSANTVVGLMSPSSIASENVKNEWDWAIANNRRLILMLIEPCEVPFHYVSRNYIDFTRDHEAGYQALAAALSQPAQDLAPAVSVDEAAAGEVPPRPSHAFSSPRSGSRLRRALSHQQVAPPLVGREREQAEIERWLEEAIDGKGSLILLGGEAGIGKTTLVRWLRQRAEGRGALVLSGGCYDLTTTPPHGPWIGILQSYDPVGDLPAVPDQIRDEGGLASISSQIALFEIVGEFFAEISEHKPLVLVLEDLHWSDPASLEFLRFFARFLSGLPVLIVATYRDDELTRRHQLTELMPVLVRETQVGRMSLHRLDSAAIHQLVGDRYSLPTPDADRLVSYLDRLAEGNPFFTEELLQSLIGDGLLRKEDAAWVLGDLKDSEVPPLVRQVIERRLAKLDDATRDLLAVAAVIGHDVRYDLWRKVSAAEEEQIVAAVEQAIDARLIEETVDGRGMAFSHALVREALYGGLVALRRQARHRAVADALIVSPDADPDIVAYHLEQANDPRLVEWLIAAGERAQRRYAWLMAAERFNRAQRFLEYESRRSKERARLLLRIGLLLRYSDDAESLAYLNEAQQLAEETGDSLVAAQARAHRGLVLAYQRQISEAIEEMEASLAALDQLRATGAEVENWRDDPLWRPILGVQGWGTLALWLAIAGRVQEAMTILDTHEAGSEEPETADRSRARAIVSHIRGDFERARDFAQRSTKAYLALGDLWQAGSDVQIESLLLARFATERVDERREIAETAYRIWSDVAGGSMERWPPAAAHVSNWYISGEWHLVKEATEQYASDEGAMGELFLHSRGIASQVGRITRNQGNVSDVWKMVGELFPVGPTTEPGNQNYFASVNMLLLAADLALDAADLPRARAWLNAFDNWQAWNSATLWRAEGSLAWARYYHLAGKTAESRQRAEQALAGATEPRQPLVLIATHRFLGTLDAEDGDEASAADHFQVSLSLAESCEAPFEKAQTLLEDARLQIARGDHDRARSRLAEVRQVCEPLEARPALERVAEIEARLETIRG